MEKQSKISKFLKTTAQPRQIFQSSELQIESVENKNVGHQKSQPNLINFLKKIDQSTLQIMQKYLFENKHLLQLPVKPKISLYEDIMIIFQFRSSLDNLRRDRTKTVQYLSQKLQPIIKRSKVTIKERISKKLSRCSIEDVLESMKTKKDLMFQKTKKNQHSSNEDLDNIKSQQKMKQQRAPTNLKKQTLEQKPTEQDKQKDMAKQIPNGKLYKYGTKTLKERIFIYANRTSRQMINFSQSSFNQMKKKYQIQSDISLKNNQPMAIQVNQQKINADTIMQENKSEEFMMNIQKISSLNGEQLRNFVSSIKEKANQVLVGCDENSTGSHKQLQNYLQIIKQLQQKLTPLLEIKNNEFQQDISSDISAQKSDIKGTKATESTGKKTTESTPLKQVNQQQIYKKMFEQVNKNPKYLEIISNNNELKHQYMWQRQEDDILYNFKFNSDAYRTEMICLLRYKTRDVILERMKYLNIDINFNLIEQVNKLQNKGIETIPHQQQLMDVE